MPLESYQNLKTWQLGTRVARLCYQLTRQFPKDELFGASSQIRRASSRIPANIAEGYGRGHRGEYLQFHRIAYGSLRELETLLIVSARVGLTYEEDTVPILTLCDEEGRMLLAQIRSLEI